MRLSKKEILNLKEIKYSKSKVKSQKSNEKRKESRESEKISVIRAIRVQ